MSGDTSVLHWPGGCLFFYLVAQEIPDCLLPMAKSRYNSCKIAEGPFLGKGRDVVPTGRVCSTTTYASSVYFRGSRCSRVRGRRPVG